MDLFGSRPQQQAYVPPPPPPPNPISFADASKSPGASPTPTMIGAAGGTNVTGGLQTEASTTRKTLLGQ